LARWDAFPNTAASSHRANLFQAGFFGVALHGRRKSAPRRIQFTECAATGENRHRTAGSCGIAIMAKASAPGRSKTRLVPPLTFEQAAALNTAFLQDIAGNLLLAGSYAAIAGYVAFAPAGSEQFFRGT
jgi:hypothetical protein